jgi:hypothetical protein
VPKKTEEEHVKIPAKEDSLYRATFTCMLHKGGIMEVPVNIPDEVA